MKLLLLLLLIPNLAWASIDIISTNTCKHMSVYLQNCVISEKQLTTPYFDTAVPLRTTITRTISGDCSTYFPLALKITEDTFVCEYKFLQDASIILRRKDGNAIAKLLIEDRYASCLTADWCTKIVALPDTCQISIDVTFNIPDVDSKAEAQAIIDKIQKEITAKINERNSYGDLLLFSHAYFFFKSIADNFYGQLTNASMQDLRTLFKSNKDILKEIMTNVQGPYSQEQRILLFNLYLSLFTLGDAADWQNPDGTTKTIEQYLGADAINLMASIQEILTRLGNDPTAVYQAAYQKAAQEVEVLQAKLSLATLQLQEWLK